MGAGISTVCSEVISSQCGGGCGSLEYCQECTTTDKEDGGPPTTTFECEENFSKTFVAEILPILLGIFAIGFILILVCRRRLLHYLNHSQMRARNSPISSLRCGGVCLTLPFLILLIAGGSIASNCNDKNTKTSGFCFFTGLYCYVSFLLLARKWPTEQSAHAIIVQHVQLQQQQQQQMMALNINEEGQHNSMMLPRQDIFPTPPPTQAVPVTIMSETNEHPEGSQQNSEILFHGHDETDI